MEGFKQCPECQSTDVPMNAGICPFCGHSFERQPAAKPAVKKPEKPPETTDFIMVTNDEPKKPEPKKGTEPVKAKPVAVTDKVQNTGKTTPAAGGNAAPVAGSGTAPASSQYKTYQKGNKAKKKHGFLKFLIVIAVIYGIWAIFIKSSLEGGEDIQTGGAGDTYSRGYESTEPESTEPESWEDNAGDEWLGESGEESLEMGSEETPTDAAGENHQFILPLSDQVYLTREDLVGLSAEELRIARNEIYARHGRLFKDEGLQAYFNSCDWYVGTIPGDEFTDSVFNEYERANKDLIVSYEHELGVNGQ